MTMSFEAPRLEASQRATALARRMLGGAAAATIDAYRSGQQLDCVAHGIAPDGTLVVAAVPSGGLALLEAGVGVDVRLDAVRHTPDPSVALVAASVHLLGVLSWLDDDAAASARRAEGGLPPLVEAMVAVPGARLGRIDMERAVLHDMTGATPVGSEILRAELAELRDEHLGFELVAAYPDDAMRDLCWAVMVGAVPGEVATKAAPGACAHIAERVYCVDVDALGVTLMLVGGRESVVVFAAFGVAAACEDDLACGVRGLMFEASAAAAA